MFCLQLKLLLVDVYDRALRCISLPDRRALAVQIYTAQFAFCLISFTNILMPDSYKQYEISYLL